jgi:hypothetical protein
MCGQANFNNFDVFVVLCLLNWFDQYTITQNQSNGWNVIQRVYLRKILGCSPNVTFETFLVIPLFPLVDLNWSVCWLWKSVEWLKSYSRGFFTKISRLLPWYGILRTLMTSFCSPCCDESISILFVKISRLVEKVFKGVIFTKIPRSLP